MLRHVHFIAIKKKSSGRLVQGLQTAPPAVKPPHPMSTSGLCRAKDPISDCYLNPSFHQELRAGASSPQSCRSFCIYAPPHPPVLLRGPRRLTRLVPLSRCGLGAAPPRWDLAPSPPGWERGQSPICSVAERWGIRNALHGKSRSVQRTESD